MEFTNEEAEEFAKRESKEARQQLDTMLKRKVRPCQIIFSQALVAHECFVFCFCSVVDPCYYDYQFCSCYFYFSFMQLHRCVFVCWFVYYCVLLCRWK
jgi:hypothetical protein